MTSTSPPPPEKSLLPPWEVPNPPVVSHDMGLHIMNSLTRSKDRFITMDGSKQVRWYMCGPTVYAPSHMGHARTYLGFDIIHRILSDFFHYDVSLIMNITDIDDKIIDRSNEQGIPHLELSQKFEQEFHQDMAMLGVQPPHVVTRVTEYMDEIVAYIAQIIQKGFAYESNGSVYFNSTSFESADNDHHYCKLAPEQINNAALLAEGEGKLTQDFVSDKQSPRDFALWKRVKAKEPSWDSPWGPGRPGWHIECSVMASDVLEQLSTATDGVPNPCMDIHSGGVDLKFPHHDNEMAQAEAHSGCTQWVNYFVHAGHLHIKGFKMSKSLKNFITIREALETNTARQIRMCFLLHKYNAPMDYGDNTMSHAMSIEKVFKEFFHNCKAVLRDGKMSDSQKWNPPTRDMQLALQAAQKKVDEALRDDFDTPTVMATLGELVKSTNLYMEAAAAPGTTHHLVHLVIRNVASYVTRMFKVFGLIGGIGDIGFDSGASGSTASNREETLQPVLDALMDFRSAVRDAARAKDIGSVLQQCDAFRDDALPELGIRLEDKTGGKSVWKLADPAELRKEKEQKELEAQRKQEEKNKAADDKRKKDALTALSPAEYMMQLTLDDSAAAADNTGNAVPKYTQFDATTGMPTHAFDKELLNKNQSKKAAKEFQAHQKKYDKYVQQQEKSSAS